MGRQRERGFLAKWSGCSAGVFKGSTTAVMRVSRETPISQVTGPPIVNAAESGDSVFVAGER